MVDIQTLQQVTEPKPKRSGDLVAVTFRCPRALRKELREFLGKEERTVQEVCEAAIRQYLDRNRAA